MTKILAISGSVRRDSTNTALLLIYAPEYAHGVPGGLKNLLDWVVGWGELAETLVELCRPRSTATMPRRCWRRS